MFDSFDYDKRYGNNNSDGFEAANQLAPTMSTFSSKSECMDAREKYFYSCGLKEARLELIRSLEDEAIISWLLSRDNEGDYKKLISDIILWNVQVALDPIISIDAKNLINKGIDISIAKIKEIDKGTWFKNQEDTVSEFILNLESSKIV